MKNFWEKLKDALYDGGDYIIMLLIIVGVVFIINWRLDGLFAESHTDISSNSLELIEDNQSDSNNKASDINKGDEIENNLQSDKNEDKNKDKITTSNTSNIEPKETTRTILEVDIPAGSASSNIANILINKGLIEDKNAFLKKLTELNLETKLRHGKYKIPENSSLDEILNILTR